MRKLVLTVQDKDDITSVKRYTENGKVTRPELFHFTRKK